MHGRVKCPVYDFKAAYFYQVAWSNYSRFCLLDRNKEKIAELEALYNWRNRKNNLPLQWLMLNVKKLKKQPSFLYGDPFGHLHRYLSAYRQKSNRNLRSIPGNLNWRMCVERTKELENQIMERKIAEESDKLKSAFLLICRMNCGPDECHYCLLNFFANPTFLRKSTANI
jgi:hypothetical protein